MRGSLGSAAVAVGLAFTAALAPSTAMAHVGVGETSGFLLGFTHPFSGLDHILAMAAVGLIAAQLGGRGLWLLPAAFLSIMAFAGALAMAGIGAPFVELAIGISIVALGGIVATGIRPSVVSAMAIVGFLAIWHGQAHGSELPLGADALAYGLGFVVASAVLQLIGIGLGSMIARAAGKGQGTVVVRSVGGGVTLAGIGILFGLI